MANVSLQTDGDAVGHRRGDARTLEEHVDKWAARRMLAGVSARRCVLPFLTGAPKAAECRLCSKIIYAGEGIACSVRKCPQMFHINCVVKDTPNFTAESFRCPQHGCVVCKQNMFFWRCGRCTVAAHTRCAPWPVTHLNDDQVSAICWRHPSDWLLQNKNADLTNNIEDVFCRLPLPYVNGNFNIDSTIRDFAGDVYRPPPYTSIRRNLYLIKKRRTGVRVDTGCTNCRADSTCKEDCECRSLSMGCSKNCRCSDLCTNRPFRKDKKIKIVKTIQFGWDAVASEPIEKGDFIIEYVGEVIDDATREKRLWDIRQRSDKTLYMCEIRKDFTIDATFKGNISRFINHSYEPNCKLEKWLVDGETRVGIFASHSIEVGVPLTYDCRFLHFGDKVKCHHEASNLQGYLGNQIKNPTQNALATATQGKLHEYSPTEQGSSAPSLKSATSLLPWTNCTEVSFNLRSKRKINRLCWADKRKRTSLMASPASMRTSEVFCRPPAPYANEEVNINPTIKEFPGTVYKPPPYTPISCNVSVNNVKHVGVPAKAGCTNCSVDSSCNYESLCRPVRRYKKKSFSLFHPFGFISEAVARTPDNASIGDKAQHVANVGEEQNNTDSLRGMVDSGKLGLDHAPPQDLDGSLSLGVSADVDKQTQRSDEHVSERPLTRSKRGISKKHKAITAMPCIEETGSAHPDSRSAQGCGQTKKLTKEKKILDTKMLGCATSH